MQTDNFNSAFDFAAMDERKKKFFEFIRSQRLVWFNEYGLYRPETENDSRITYWILPALISSPDPAVQEWARYFYISNPCWDGYNVFTSSAISANLVRERKMLTPELIRKSEDHLSKFTFTDGGRVPCAGVYDYMFHGYNDNMPAMATRQMIFAGEALGRKDFLDHGLFNLEGLCAHLQRRGMITEHTSGTYSPITLTMMMDIAECSVTKEAREMALACASRIILDLFGHFHQTSGALGGVQSRAYSVDLVASISTVNVLFWYLTGHPLLVDPIEALSDTPFDGVMHHGGCRAFNGAAFTELFSPSYRSLDPKLIEFARSVRPAEYEVSATTDYGSKVHSGNTLAASSITRSYHRKSWCLSSIDFGAAWSGQKTCLQGTVTTRATPSSWRDRTNFWEYLTSGHDYGEQVSNYRGVLAETDNVDNCGEFRTLQKKGTAMSLGLIAPRLADMELANLTYGLIFATYLKMPDEIFEDDTPLSGWKGEAKAGSWQFLRFGQAYVGLRMLGITGADGLCDGKTVLPQRVIRNKYLRLEIPLIANQKTKMTSSFRDWSNFGCVIEVADQEECGSFAEFRKQCRSGIWEYYQQFDRNARYQGRNAELQISDSPADGSVKFMAVDGLVPRTPNLFEATGLDPEIVRLFPDGRHVKARRLLYVPDSAGSPYATYKGRVLADK